MLINYSKLHPNAKTPVFNPMENAGVDLFPVETVKTYREYKSQENTPFGTIQYPQTSVYGGSVPVVVTKKEPLNIFYVDTGLAFDFPVGLHSFVAGRGGNAFKKHIIPFYGVVDSSYRGEVKVMLHNHNLIETEISPDVAIAQLVFFSYNKDIDISQITFKEVAFEELSKTSRNDKAFGSSGSIS